MSNDIEFTDQDARKLCDRLMSWRAKSSSLQLSGFLRENGLRWRELKKLMIKFPDLGAEFDRTVHVLHARWCDLAFSPAGKNMSPPMVKAFVRYLRVYDDYGLEMEARSNASNNQPEAKPVLMPTPFSCADMEIDPKFAEIARRQNAHKERPGTSSEPKTDVEEPEVGGEPTPVPEPFSCADMDVDPRFTEASDRLQEEDEEEYQIYKRTINEVFR